MIKVQAILLRNSVIENQLTIEVDNFTPNNCKEVAKFLGDLVFENENIIQFQYDNWTILFVKTTHTLNQPV